MIITSVLQMGNTGGSVTRLASGRRRTLNPPTLASALGELMKAVGDDKGLEPRPG